MIRRALLSVSDKRGLVELATALRELGIELISTDGTARLLQENGIPVTPIEAVTGMPEILGGRVKTLHPMIHGGLLARRDRPEDVEDMHRHAIVGIDLVVVNLYPFEATVARDDVTVEEAIEQIDIGGVTLLRAAAKNYRYVTVVSDPDDYPALIDALRAHHRQVPEAMRAAFAVKAFRQTALYDAMISDWLADHLETDVAPFPDVLPFGARKATDLRYGENPHQQGALYRVPNAGGLAHAEQLQGKGMSYTNWLDAEGAWLAVQQFETPAVVIVKHASPCGIATHPDLVQAYRHALASDPVSAFGGIVAVNRPVDKALAEAMDDLFIEVLLAPEITPEAREHLAKKKNRRVLVVPPLRVPYVETRSIPGGFIRQTPDAIEAPVAMQCVTTREPTDEERATLDFAWRACLAVKSNAIVLARAIEGGFATVGIGTGQPSRVDAVRLAVRKAGEQAVGAVMASDAFFPFPDGVEVAAEAGVTAVIQPGGSRRDAEVIETANRYQMAMVLTGVRHFRH
nr:bifunctional phosphoribosylaminoimidazolecarboxamide formyltransferase/IMP cyclohydrolase [Ardenticatena sp.]